MMETLKLAIVGHTNVGKTSFLRTLTRNPNFGAVSNKPSTTRHVEGVKLALKQNQSIIFYDTPGLEDSIALYDYINDLVSPKEKLDGIDKLTRFLSSPEAENRFEQEAKVIRQLLKSDAGLYVIDVREPILDKYHDELAVLSDSNKPLLAVLNFTGSEESQEEAWKRLLSRVGIYAVIRYDAVLPPLDGEVRLYQSLALLVEPAKKLIDHLLIELNEKSELRYHSANLIIAETLIDIAACYRFIKLGDNKAIEQLQDSIREREHKAIKALLKVYQFNEYEQNSYQLPIVEGRFESDLFNTEALKLMGIQLSKGVVSGAIAGAGIDLAVGGMTLGSAALIGAAIGGLSQTIRHYGTRISSKISGQSRLSVDNTIICFLALRLQQLQSALAVRGHANQEQLALPMLQQESWQKGKLPKVLASVRAHPEWSSLNKGFKVYAESRKRAIEQLAEELEQYAK